MKSRIKSVFLKSALVFFAALGTSAAIADDAIVRVGFAAPLTGSNANYGKDLENGVRLALEDAKAQGVKIDGKPVSFELVSQDDQGDPRVGVQVAQKLVDDNVNVVIGHFNSGVTIPASMVYDKVGIPMIDPAATNPTITQRGLKNIFSVIATDAQLCGKAGRYAVKVTGAKRIAVLDDRTAYGQGQADAFAQAVAGAGGNIVAREYTNDKAVDFRTQLTNIKSANADLVFFGGLEDQASLIAKQMKQLGMRAQLVGGGMVDADFVKLAGAAAEGVMGWQYGVPLTSTPAGRDFAQRFKKRFDTDALSFSPNAYDATWAAIKAMQTAGSVRPNNYLAFLQATSFDGVTGRVSFNNDGSLKSASATLFVVKNGAWVPVVTRASAD